MTLMTIMNEIKGIIITNTINGKLLMTLTTKGLSDCISKAV